MVDSKQAALKRWKKLKIVLKAKKHFQRIARRAFKKVFVHI
jgi:hypothetical protein